MATTTAPLPESQPAISPLGRIIGVFFSPQATFQNIVKKPSWFFPVILYMILGALVAFGLNQKMNWREYVSQQIDKSPSAAQLSPDQKLQRVEAGAKFAPISAYIFGIPAPIVIVLAVALVMWGAYNLLGGTDLDYKTSLAIVSHAFAPWLLGNILFLIVLFLKPPGTLDLNNPVATNVAALLPEDIPQWLDALCKNIDLFVIWILLLMAIGFAAANPKKLKGARAFTIAFTVFAAYVVIRMGIAFAFS